MRHRLEACCCAEAKNAFCVGVDVSQEALAEGKRSVASDLVRSAPKLARARASALPFPSAVSFEVVIVSFVLHWIDRRHLLRAVAEIDGCLREGGWLVLADFLPSKPTKVPYHHLRGSGIFTYKQNYSEVFTASGLYNIERFIVFDHDDSSMRAEVYPKGEPALESIPESQRAGAWLLRKEASGVHELSELQL